MMTFRSYGRQTVDSAGLHRLATVATVEFSPAARLRRQLLRFHLQIGFQS